MNIDNIKDTELQRLRLSYSVKYLSQLFSKDTSEIYRIMGKRNILPPPEYLKKMNKERLTLLICQHGHEKIAESFQVSVSFLKGLFKNGMSSKGYVPVIDPEFDFLSMEGLEDRIRTYQSPGIVSRMFSVPKSRLPKVDVDTSKLGQSHTAIGRRAELFVLETIGGRDMNLEDPRSLWDIEHTGYGKINVKATKKWPPRAPKTNNCDYVALVYYKGEKIEKVSLVPASLCPITVNPVTKNPDIITIFDIEKLRL